MKNLEAVKDDKLDVKNGEVLKRNADHVQLPKRADRVIDDDVAMGQVPQDKENVPKIDLPKEDKIDPIKNGPREDANLPKEKVKVAPAQPAADNGQKLQAPAIDSGDVEVDLVVGDKDLNVGVAGER